MAKVIGEVELQRRLHALQGTGERTIITKIVTQTVGYFRKNMPRKTGLTAASTLPHVLSPTKATITGSPVAVWLDTGTGLYGPLHRKITPKAAQALRFYRGSFGSGGSLRLSGAPRKGKAGAGAQLVFARSVKGMHARPYINRSVQEASQKVGQEVGAAIVTAWNGAA